MIRITFTEPETRKWKRWIKDCLNETEALKLRYQRGQPFEVTDVYRRKSIKHEVYFAQTGPFKGRCAYCESNVTDFQSGDIDHFRPKKGVTDESDKPIIINEPDGSMFQHQGYYWLAYKWTNLLPSCAKCNQPGDEGTGKRNRFPLKEPKYALEEGKLADEKPLLFNPADPTDEDPEEHLGVDFESGLMTFKNDSKRGEMCIKIFGLNTRDQLVQERRAALNEVKAKYAEAILAQQNRFLELRKELDDMERGLLSHTLARRAQMKNIRERLGR